MTGPGRQGRPLLRPGWASQGHLPLQEAHAHPQVGQREAPSTPQREHGRKAVG